MIKKSFWSLISGFFLLASLSLLSACSDAEESISEKQPATEVVQQKQAETAKAPKNIEGTLQDIEGRYIKIPTPQATMTGDKIEVLEVFWYGCPHCYEFEPTIEKWLAEKADYIEFVRIPGVMAKNWLPHARAYYAAEKLGVLEKIHRPLFNAIHKQRRKIIDENSLKSFFAEQGISGDAFEQAYTSREVEEKVRNAYQIGQRYQLTGVPTILINGKYGTSVSMAGGNDKIMDVIDILSADEYAHSKDGKHESTGMNQAEAVSE